MISIKRIAAFLLLIGGYSISNLSAQTTAKFNFSLASHTVSGWVNVAGDPSTGIRTGVSGSVHITSINTTRWYQYNNTAAFDGGGMTGGSFFPSGVMANMWFQYSEFYGAYNAALPQLEISGLSIDSVYTISMTTSFNTNTFNFNPTRYTVAGATVYGYGDVYGNNNVTDGAVFHNIAPDSNGKVQVYVNTALGSNTAGISGIQIVSGHTTTPMPVVSITHPSDGDIIPEDGNVIITATASETGGTIGKVEFYADTVKIGEDSTAPYSMTWYNPDEGHYTIKARAIDGVGNTSTASVNISVESLTSFWSVTGNIAANADSNFLGTVDTNRLALRTNNVERVSILGDGTVGIGTKATQGYKLAVNGSAIFTKVRIRAYAGWPDYVFKKDYHLPGLDSLEKYIRLHQHLPGVTPAATVKEEGIDIADDHALLLKKVEELTLYLIQEHKQVEALAREVKQLRGQNQQLKKQNKGKGK
ncbi:MAG: Ig-like domain-containing protein [Bacteroidota bacterium]